MQNDYINGKITQGVHGVYHMAELLFRSNLTQQAAEAAETVYKTIKEWVDNSNILIDW